MRQVYRVVHQLSRYARPRIVRPASVSNWQSEFHGCQEGHRPSPPRSPAYSPRRSFQVYQLWHPDSREPTIYSTAPHRKTYRPPAKEKGLALDWLARLHSSSNRSDHLPFSREAPWWPAPHSASLERAFPLSDGRSFRQAVAHPTPPDETPMSLPYRRARSPAFLVTTWGLYPSLRPSTS